jgi:hypothetical protein
MARSHARIFTVIWDDPDFLALTGLAQRCYLMLLSQPTLGHAGVLSTTVRRWTFLCADEDEGRLRAAIAELAERRFVVVDERTEELLVRSLIRNDGAWKQPKVLAVAITEAASIMSAALRACVAEELARIDCTGLPDATRPAVEALLKDLPARLANAHLEVPDQAPPHPPADPPPHPPGQPHPNGASDGVRVRARAAPAPSPALIPPPPPGAAPRLTLVPGEARPGEGEDLDQEREELIRGVREIRLDWSTASIRRVLKSEPVAERPWPLVRNAALAVARDPESKHPGRLAHDGWWWHLDAPGEPRASPGKSSWPPWCGYCSDPEKRQVFDSEDRPKRCPNCHPLAAKELA